jgi:hypothetical protein
VECDRRFAADIKKLTQLAKEADLVTKMWGKHAHICEVVDKDSTPSEIKQLIKVAQTHTNYQCPMILDDIVGITNLDTQQLPSLTKSPIGFWAIYLFARSFSDFSNLVMAINSSLRSTNQMKSWVQSKRLFPTLLRPSG